MTESYVNLYLNSAFADGDFSGFLSLLFLFFGRMLPIIGLSPFFGAKVLPHPIKLVFGLSLFVIFLPQLLTEVKSPLTFNFYLITLFFKELFIGTLMGFMIGIPFMIVQSTGIVIDHQRGGASLMVNDPTIQNQSSPLGTLFNFVLIFQFFWIDGPFMVIEAVSNSYQVLPIDTFLSPNFFRTDSVLAVEIMKIMGKIMIVSTQLGAPALIIILMTDFFLGVVNRLAPQVQITFLGMPLKSLLGLGIIFLGWQLFTEQMIKEALNWINHLNQLILNFNPKIT